MLRSSERGELRMSLSAQATPVADAEAIWEQFHEGLLGFISRRVRSREIAEDILQEVMLQIHRRASDVERTEAIAAWVHRIARNAITDHYRRASVRRELPAGTEINLDETATEPEDGQHVRAELARCCVAPLLERLPPIYREALTMTEIEGMTQAEAATRLDLSLSGMKSRVQRARSRLKQVFLDCCEIDLDRRRSVTGYRPRRDCDC